MNKNFYYLFIFFFISVRLIAQNNNHNLLVKEEASLKALDFLNLIPVGQEMNYGFTSRSDFSKIKIEEPYQMYYVANSNDKLTLISANEWRVPLSVEGHFAALLTVQFKMGKPEVVDFGGNVLAKKMQEFEALHSIEQDQRVLIRNTFLKRDYIPTNFNSLFIPNNPAAIFEINEKSQQAIYQLGEGIPLKTSIAVFCNETNDFIYKTKENK